MGQRILTDEIGQHVGIERIQFPGLASKLGYIGAGSRIGDLGWIWRWAIEPNLVDVESNAVESQRLRIITEKTPESWEVIA